MDAHRSRSLGMAALVFILISLTAAVFHGAAPVRAEDTATPTPIVIDENTADVTVELYTDENRKVPLGNTAVLSTATLYGSFRANFEANHKPSEVQNVAEYSLPDGIKAFDNTGGSLMDGTKEAGSWRCENNKLIFILMSHGLRHIHPMFMSVPIFHSSWQMRTLAPAIKRKSNFLERPELTLRPKTETWRERRKESSLNPAAR